MIGKGRRGAKCVQHAEGDLDLANTWKRVVIIMDHNSEKLVYFIYDKCPNNYINTLAIQYYEHLVKVVI